MSVTPVRLERQPLEQIATIRSGYSPRRIDLDPFGEYRALQARDFPAAGEVAWSRLLRPRVPADPERYAVRDDDLVLLLRGASVRVWPIVRPPERVIMLGHFAIVTAKHSVADPAYLLWYLNQSATLKRLQQISKGTSLTFVPMGEFRRFEVALPPIAVQRGIGRVHTLAYRERVQSERLDALRRQHLDLQLLRAAQAR